MTSALTSMIVLFRVNDGYVGDGIDVSGEGKDAVKDDTHTLNLWEGVDSGPITV